MPFLLLDAEQAADGVRRLAREQIDEAVEALRDPQDPDAAVHTARKACKRLRALLRLARGPLGKSTYRRENEVVRDAARQLAGARDAAVLCAAFDRLVATANDPAAFDDVRAQLPGQQGTGASTAAISAAIQALLEVRERAADWPLDSADWKVFGPGLRRIHARGAQGAADARQEAAADDLHEWRKSAKHLWHAVEVLTPTWPAVLGPLADEIHALADALGDDHDLALLITALEQLTPRPDGLLQLAERRRDDLQARARALGRRVYADDTKAFTRRMRRVFAAWQADTAT